MITDYKELLEQAPDGSFPALARWVESGVSSRDIYVFLNWLGTEPDPRAKTAAVGLAIGLLALLKISEVLP